MLHSLIECLIFTSLDRSEKPIPFTLRNTKAVEDFPILHGYFQSRMDFPKIQSIDLNFQIDAFVK